MTQTLTREQLLGADDQMPRDCVSLPGFGLVYVRSITAEEREQWEAAPPNRIRATLVALAACDENGVKLFTLGDVPTLAAQPAGLVVPIFEAAVRLAKILPGDVDALEKNSEPGP